jgi:hypothetical protein
MPGKIRYPVVIIFFTVFLLFGGKIAFAQQLPVLDRKVSFTFTDMTLANVLRAIGNKSGVKFSYNPDLIQSSRRITMRFNNVPMRDMLKQILNDPSISMREIGNQIVLYRGDPSMIPLEPNQQLRIGKPQVVVPPKKVPDTVYVYRLDTLIINNTDTIFRTVSIFRYDTVRVMDTVYIEKGKTSREHGEINSNNQQDSVPDRLLPENNGFYTGFSFEVLTGTAKWSSSSSASDDYASQMEATESGSTFKYSTGLIAGYDYRWFGVQTGAGFMKLGEKFDYGFTVQSGGFFDTDTVETYYSVAGTDTAWFFITDSTWIPEVSDSYNYNNLNTFNYIDIPLSFKLRAWQNQIAGIYAFGGINASFLVSADALHIDPEDKNNVLVTSKDDLNSFLFAWHAGIGAAVKLSTRAGLIAEANYRKQTTSQYKSIPVNKTYGLFGISVAAYLRF